jgi:hypothetical protein
MGVAANRRGVTINELFTRNRIAWSDLEDILLEAGGEDGKERWLDFVTRQGRRVTASEATGTRRRTAHLKTLRATLLAMRNQYTAPG